MEKVPIQSPPRDAQGEESDILSELLHTEKGKALLVRIKKIRTSLDEFTKIRGEKQVVPRQNIFGSICDVLYSQGLWPHMSKCAIRQREMLLEYRELTHIVLDFCQNCRAYCAEELSGEDSQQTLQRLEAYLVRLEADARAHKPIIDTMYSTEDTGIPNFAIISTKELQLSTTNIAFTFYAIIGLLEETFFNKNPS